MVEAVCACGQKQSVAENRLGDIAPCACGRAMSCVSAEQLPEGAGNGDFDARLIVSKGPAEVGKQILLGGCMEIELGKLPERHVALLGPKVSRLHAKLQRIDFGPSRWKLVDNNSTNGVFVNGEKVSERELENADVIGLGDYELRFENAPAMELTEEEPPIAQLATSAPTQGKMTGLLILFGCGIALAIAGVVVMLVIPKHASNVAVAPGGAANASAQTAAAPAAGQASGGTQSASPMTSSTAAQAAAAQNAVPPSAANATSIPQGSIARVGAGGTAMKLTDAIPWPHDLVLANFDTQAAADNEFASAAATTGKGEVLEKFGQTIFACMPKGDDAAKNRWTSQLQAHGKDTRADTDQGVSFVSILCTAPTDKDAEDLERDWQTYFSVPAGLYLIPPWMPNDSRPAAEVARDELARQTYWKILNVDSGRDAQIEQMSRQMFSAAARRDRARAQTIAQQIADRRMQLRQQALDGLSKTTDGSVDTALVKEFQALPPPKITDDESGTIDSPQWLAMGKRMGQLPMVNGKPALGVDQYSTRRGFLGRRGSTVSVELARFDDPASGAPAMVDWLSQHHFINIQYHVDIMPDPGTMRIHRNPMFVP